MTLEDEIARHDAFLQQSAEYLGVEDGEPSSFESVEEPPAGSIKEAVQVGLVSIPDDFPFELVPEHLMRAACSEWRRYSAMSLDDLERAQERLFKPLDKGDEFEVLARKLLNLIAAQRLGDRDEIEYRKHIQRIADQRQASLDAMPVPVKTHCAHCGQRLPRDHE